MWNLSSKLSIQQVLKTQKLAVHDGKKPFKCEICDFSFALKQSLKTHIGSFHEGNKLYKCEMCDNSFAQKSHLRKHVSSVHDGKKPWKCDICETRFLSFLLRFTIQLNIGQFLARLPLKGKLKYSCNSNNGF